MLVVMMLDPASRNDLCHFWTATGDSWDKDAVQSLDRRGEGGTGLGMKLKMLVEPPSRRSIWLTGSDAQRRRSMIDLMF